MTSQDKGLSDKTKERYDLFVDCYLQSFNATKSAIAAGYSKKTARQQGHKLLTKGYIKEKIQYEMERLRDLMKDEGLRSFSMLLNIALETEEKLQRHNEAEEKIEKIKLELNNLSLEIMKLNNDLTQVQRMADAIDGRKKDMKEQKRSLLSQIDSINTECFSLNFEKAKLINQLEHHKMYYLDNKEWEKLQNLKKSVFQDILDRGGFKATDKVEHTGKDGSPLSLTIKL